MRKAKVYQGADVDSDSDSVDSDSDHSNCSNPSN